MMGFANNSHASGQGSFIRNVSTENLRFQSSATISFHCPKLPKTVLTAHVCAWHLL